MLKTKEKEKFLEKKEGKVMICKKCGTYFEEGKYCPTCGTYMADEQQLITQEEEIEVWEEPQEESEGEPEEQSKAEQRAENNALMKKELEKPKGHNRFTFLLGAVAGIVVLIILAFALGSSRDPEMKELYSYRNITEDGLINDLGYTQNATGVYPGDNDVVFSCEDGQVKQIYFDENHQDDFTFMGVKIMDDAEASKARFEKGFTYQDSDTDENGNLIDIYIDEEGQLTVTYDMQDYSISSICYVKENTVTEQVETETTEKEESTETKVAVVDDTYQTVITAKSNNFNNIQLFTTAGGADTAGKIPEGVPCALLKQQDVNGEPWAQIDFCNRQGWCKMEMLRTVSGDTKYFYVKPNDSNTVFVNENSIKLHNAPGNKADITFSDVGYGTELTIYEVNNGWGRTMYENTESWIDMSVVGFYASEYWQVERCDGSTTGIKLRESASENSEALATVPLRTVLTTTDFKNGWAKFSYDNHTGWMKLHYATPCGSTSGLSFSEDKTEATTETQPTTEAVQPAEPTARFAGYCYPYSGYYYSYGRGEYLGVYMVLEDVSDTQFTFTIYNEDGVLFRTHTAVATSDNTAFYDGVDYDLTFKMNGEGGINVFGLEEFLGKFNYFEYES